jgi:hypothetical protein
MKKFLILFCLQFLFFINSYSQVRGIPLKVINLGNDIELFESKLTPSAKKMYDEVISKYLGDIQSYEIEVPDSFYNFTVSLKPRNFLYVAKEKYENFPEKTDIQDFDTYGTKYKKVAIFYFSNESEKYECLEFFLFPN